MLLQTNLLTQLADKGLQLAVIVPDKDDPSLKPLQAHDSITLFDGASDLGFWQRQWKTFRKYALQDITANPALYEKYYYDISKDKPLAVKLRARLGMLITNLIGKSVKRRNYFRNKEKKWLRSNKLGSLLNDINPKVLVATYPMMSPEDQLLLAAHNQGRQRIIHLLSWDNITSKGVFPALADRYIVWGPIMKNELVEHYGVNEDNIRAFGVPHFDFHVEVRHREHTRELLKEYFGLDPDRPFAMMTLSAPRFAPREIDIARRLADEVDKGRFGDLQLLVRPHPQNVSGRYKDDEWLDILAYIDSLSSCYVNYPRMTEGATLPWSTRREDMIRLSVALKHCAIAINSGSTTAVEALIFDRPVIFTSFDADEDRPYWYSSRRMMDYTHLKKLTSKGGIDITYSEEKFYDKIDEALAHPDAKQSLRKSTLMDQLINDNGTATKDIVDFLHEYVTDKEFEQVATSK